MDMEKDTSKKSVNPNKSNLLLDSDIGEILPMTEKIKVKPPVKFQFHSYKAKNKKKH